MSKQEKEFEYSKYAIDDDVREGVSKLGLAYKAKAKAQRNTRRAGRIRKAYGGSGCDEVS
jgi:hypothetical protein